jgi:hypothetical protein
LGRWLAPGLALACLLGCASSRPSLPVINVNRLGQKIPEIPPSAAFVYRWGGENDHLMTFWGKQKVSIEVTGYVPESYKEPGDDRWTLKARNSRGTPIPYVGVVRSYVDENGTHLSMLVPELNLDKAPDGLYFCIVPNITLKSGRVESICPTAVIFEIRNHSIKPFQVKIPLTPLQDSSLTPTPPTPPKVPAGTPIPVE